MPQQGDKIWIESLLSHIEWKEQARLYPQTYNTSTPPPPFECEFKWRGGMGAFLSETEITNVNSNIDYLLKRTE